MMKKIILIKTAIRFLHPVLATCLICFMPFAAIAQTQEPDSSTTRNLNVVPPDTSAAVEAGWKILDTLPTDFSEAAKTSPKTLIISLDDPSVNTCITKPAYWKSYDEFLDGVDEYLKKRVDSGCNLVTNTDEDGVPLLVNLALVQLGFAPLWATATGLYKGTVNNLNGKPILVSVCVSVAAVVLSIAYDQYLGSRYVNVSLVSIDPETNRTEVFEIQKVRKGKQLDALKKLLAKYNLHLIITPTSGLSGGGTLF